MFKNVILFPHKFGQLKKGVDKAPLLLKKYIKPNIINTPVVDNLETNLKNLYLENQKIEGNRINIGGDHSMSIATVADSLSKYNKLKVVWMDAHADINTYEKSLSKNVHGMPLAVLTNLEKNKNWKFNESILKFSDILYIGIRDLDPFEEEIINKHNIKFLTVDDIHYDYQRSNMMIKDFIKDDPIHLSFDVDVLDRKIMPSTGTIVDDGLELKPCKQLLNNLLNNNLVSVDIVEFNPEIGDSKDVDKSLKTVLNLFDNYIF